MDISDEALGRHLATLRKRRGVSQTELAGAVRRAGHAWRQQTVAQVETGQRPLRLNEAMVISIELGCSLEDLAWGPDVVDAVQRQMAALSERLQRLTGGE